MADYENKIIAAIDKIVEHKVNSANYDRTIQGTIVECVDATVGRYKIKYQNSMFYANAENSDITYTNNTDVYILIPGNDMSKDKTILGTVRKLANDIIIDADTESNYEKNGNNIISSLNEFGLSSFKNTMLTIYNADENIDLINLDKKNATEYIKHSSSIIISAKVKNNLKIEQHFKGNFGIIMKIETVDNAAGNTVLRDYVLDINQMQGDPYELKDWSYQYGIYPIDGKNFISIKEISLFAYNFPNQNPDAENDIWFKELGLFGANEIKEDNELKCDIRFETPQGTFFDNTNLNSEYRTLKAIVRIKGKTINSKIQKLDYYWFRENIQIDSNHGKYNELGGAGWECLNEYTVIDSATGLAEWAPAAEEYKVYKSDTLAFENKYKCVVKYNNFRLSKEITIKNFDSQWGFKIDSTNGTEFFFDTGKTDLQVAFTQKPSQFEGELTYSWAKIDNNGQFTVLPETVQDNGIYTYNRIKYNTIMSNIKNESILPEAVQPALDEALTVLEKYDKIMRVKNGKIYSLQINSIVQFATYKCSMYLEGTYLGTAAITISNSLEKRNDYNLNILTNTQVLKYNEAGIAPTSATLEKPLILEPLSFVLYNKKGEEIAKDNIDKNNVRWIIPTEDTMIIVPKEYDHPSNVDLINKTKIYTGYFNFVYGIEDRYDIRKKNNTITLEIDYQGTLLRKDFTFSFVKEGEPGTNGTEFIVKIVPNSADVVNYPMLITKNGVVNINYQPRMQNRWFSLQLWHNSKKIYEGTETGISTENKGVTLTWSILKNKYSLGVTDPSNININAVTGVCEGLAYLDEGAAANIVQCTVGYNNMTYYATLPIVTAKVVNDYTIEWDNNTGFNFAIYGADGTKPQFDNTLPFEINVFNVINSIKENVGILNKNENKVDLKWQLKGQIYNSETKAWEDNINLIEDRQNAELPKNQFRVKPVDKYNGQCLTNAIECIAIDKNQQEVAKIQIPIHLLLNRYGNAAINGWNGNSISIDEEGGVILAPQMGAGRKERDNSFTGVLMGEAKESGKTKSDVGLLGYSKGKRSIFLDAETGKAEFGAIGKGQVVIDPTSDKAELYSGNYSEKNGQGLLIDLTTPEIKYGSGNFHVDKDGHLIAKGGGAIAGWNIDDDSLFTGDKRDTDNVRFSSADFDRSINKSKQTNLRLALGDKFAVSADGTLYAGDAIIGTGTNKITIGKSNLDEKVSAIFSGNKNSFVADAAGFYLGTDGIALGNYNATIGSSPFQVNDKGEMSARSGYIAGYSIDEHTLSGGTGSTAVGISSQNGFQWAFWAGGEEASTAPFHVGHNGSLHASDADIEGSIKATSGTIGGWNIDTNRLWGGQMNINADGSLSGPNWSINANGYATFNNVFINNAGGSTNMNWGNFKVDTGGNLDAQNANFTGAIRTGSSISGSKISGGSIDIHKGNYYLTMGIDTDHPSVSGLNVNGKSHGGIRMNGHGISECGAIGNSGLLNITCGGRMNITGDQDLYLRGGDSASKILLYTGSGTFKSITSIFVTYNGNGARLGNNWVGDNVINNSNGGQINFYSNGGDLELYSKAGHVCKANGVTIATGNSTLNIKENVRERKLDDIPDILRQMKIYDYNYIKDFYDGKKSYGYIIDYLEKIPGLDKYFHFIEDNRDKKHPTKILSSTDDFSKFLLSSVIKLQNEIDELKGEKRK